MASISWILPARILKISPACRFEVAPPIGIVSTPGTPWILIDRTPHRTIRFGQAKIHGPWDRRLVMRGLAAILMPLAIVRKRREASLTVLYGLEIRVGRVEHFFARSLVGIRDVGEQPCRGLTRFCIRSGRMLRARTCSISVICP